MGGDVESDRRCEDGHFIVFGLIGGEYFKVDILHYIPGTSKAFVRVHGGAYDGMQGRIECSRLIFQDGLHLEGETVPNRGRCAG